MDNQQKNTSADPNAPAIPEQAKVPETPETRVQKQKQESLDKITEFKKDVKFLWIYGSIFCLVLLALIGGSYLLQQKMHAAVDEAQASAAQNKSRLSAIQEEVATLKEEKKALQAENEKLSAAAEADEALITSGEQIIVEMQKMLEVEQLFRDGEHAAAKELFASINQTLLPEKSQENYAYYEERLK